MIEIAPGLRLVVADCLDALRELDEASVDAVCTDPPYGINFMGKAWDGRAIAEEASRLREGDVGRQEEGRRNVRSDTGKPFEGSAYAGSAAAAGSYDVSARGNRAFQEWTEAWAREAYRVLKPGGHLLCFASTRTYHRMASGVEDAGFEVRDTLAWMFGSGFPKSLDVSKAIDARNGRTEADQHALAAHIRERREAAGYSRADVNAWFGYRDGCEHWERTDASGARIPTLTDWWVLQERLSLSDNHLSLVERVEAERERIGERTTGIGTGNGSTAYIGDNEDNRDITAPATDDARAWSGWGTALKPAFEPIVVARKPLSGTVAATVLEHGTGALNIDGCRIEFQGEADEAESKEKNRHADFGSGARENAIYGADDRARAEQGNYDPPGRWPANVLLDDEAASLLDEQTGNLAAGNHPAHRSGRDDEKVYGSGWSSGTDGDRRPTEVGGASRFFYCAKVSRAERNAGLDGFEPKPLNWSSGEQSPGTFQSDGTDREARNHHPTVKPIALMRWLIRLVTPPGGLVVDPFTGSGSTGCAASLEGMRFLGIEREVDYAEVAAARIRFWAEHGEEAPRVVAEQETGARLREAIAETGQLDLLAGA